MSLQSKQIKIIDYRNACYQGYIKDNTFDRLGAVLTQDFLFCLANWRDGMIHGQCFTVFPNQKLFYGNFQNNNVEGLVCYIQSKQCQIFAVYNRNKRIKYLAGVFPYIECVLEIQLNDSNTIKFQKQHNFKDFSQKWRILQKILNIHIPDTMKNFSKFLSNSFITKNGPLEQILSRQYLLRYNNIGLGIKINLEQQKLKQIGLYNNNNLIQTIGKIIVSQQPKVKQQGLYNKPQTLVRYQQQQRPSVLKKIYRDYFRSGIDFQNKFIHLTRIDQINKQFQDFVKEIKDNATSRIAQQLIQHLDQDYQNTKQDNNKSKIKYATPSRHQRSIMKADVSIDQLKQQLNRSISHGRSKDKSPYRQYQNNKKPAQLKYTSRTPHTENYKNNNNNIIRNLEYSPQEYKSNKYQNLINRNRKLNQDKDNSRTPNKNYQDDELMDIVRQNSRQREREKERQRQIQRQRQLLRQRQIRYPIQQGLRTLGRNNTSKSPIKLQHRPIKKYQYTQQDSTLNPQRVYPNKKKQYFPKNRQISPFNQQSSNRKKYTPTKNNRLDKLSNMYDEIQAENNQPIHPKQYNKKYNNTNTNNANTNKSYQYINDQLNNSGLGLAKTGRKMQSPAKRTTKSPYRQTPQSYQRSQYTPKLNQTNYDKKDYTDYSNRNQRRDNFEYFGRNKI